MRLLLDQNLSFRIADHLNQAGHDAVHVTDVGLGDTDDDVIFDWAAREQRTVITADADFAEMLALAGASAPSAVHLRSADHLTPDQQSQLLLQVLDQIHDDLDAGAVASVRLDRVRVRPLPIARDDERGG